MPSALEAVAEHPVEVDAVDVAGIIEHVGHEVAGRADQIEHPAVGAQPGGEDLGIGRLAVDGARLDPDGLLQVDSHQVDLGHIRAGRRQAANSGIGHAAARIDGARERQRLPGSGQIEVADPAVSQRLLVLVQADQPGGARLAIVQVDRLPAEARERRIEIAERGLERDPPPARPKSALCC